MERYHFKPTEHAVLAASMIPYAIYQYLDKRIVTVLLSEGFLRAYKLDVDEDAYALMDNNMYRDVHPDDVARISEEAIRFAESENEVYNVAYRIRIGGDYYVIHAIGRHFCPEEGVHLLQIWYVNEGPYIGNDVFHDDSLTKNYSIALYESSLQRQSNYDTLTGLPNMTYFNELAKEARDKAHAASKHCSICFANLNGMRYYNKKFGFAEGDRLLKLFADLLIKYFGKMNSCRIAQDNYVFFALSDHLEKTLDSLIMEFEVMTGKRGVSVRVGIYPDTMGVVETSLACDRAKYACNTIHDLNHSAYVRFDQSMHESETNKQYVIDHLDQALEEGWIQAYFQPIVRTANGRVCDEEALARWIDPVKGMLSPAEFIPVLEDAKLIYKVDLRMVDLVLQKLKDQAAAGFYLVPNSVNLSRTDFDACDMVEEICKRVDASGLPRRLLTIEVTESVVGSDFEFMKKQVERFRSQGFRVWMDDFGSGYSSLDVLQNIHFDVIKLDMRFMKQFNNDEKSRVIITELMKMAFGLGIETVTEGVEREDQVQFLSEVGCTRLQGYYYCKPVPLAEIIKRNEEGRQIGFENPEESEYYGALGRINLYDATTMTSEDLTAPGQYFNTLPMAVLSVQGSIVSIHRCNSAYRKFMMDTFKKVSDETPADMREFRNGVGSAFGRAVLQCAKDGNQAFVDERLTSDTTIHAMIRRIATNPVTGVTACNVVVLGVIRDTGQGVTYADIANSLSSDYLYLYYVNLETEAFTEYAPNSTDSDLTVERHGTDFFEASLRDAVGAIAPEDLERFCVTFTKAQVLHDIDENGAFTITYQLRVHQRPPMYVHMKAVRMSRDPNHLIIGVSNIDAQMKTQEDLKQLREERISLTRLTALSGNYIAVYVVDPETEVYSEYAATSDYDGLDIAKKGKDFFANSITDSYRAIFPEDQELFREMFTKERVYAEIEENGVFLINYRLMIDGKPSYVCLKAAEVQEQSGPKLIIGVSDVDSQVRRDLEFLRKKREQQEE